MRLLDRIDLAARARAERPRSRAARPASPKGAVPSPQETARRKAVCLACPEHRLNRRGKVRCNLCGCGEPFRTRRWCPVKQWGMDAWQEAARKYADASAGAENVAQPPPAAENVAQPPPAVRAAGGGARGSQHRPLRPNGLAGLRPAAQPGAAVPRSGPAQPGAAVPHRVSAVLPARDEGKQVRLTCMSFLAAGVDEIIVVDDASRDGSCDPAKLPRGVRVVRNETPMGTGRARNQGAAAATGDVLIFADAHMRAVRSVPVRAYSGGDGDGNGDNDGDGDGMQAGRLRYNWHNGYALTGTLRAFAQAAFVRDAILCAAVQPLDGGRALFDRALWTKYGGHLKPDKEGAAYRVGYNSQRPEGRFGGINALIGACYAMKRSVFDRIGGWVATRGFGYNEQALTMKAWFCGVPLLVDAETVVAHLFKRRFNYPVTKTGTRLNRWHVHAVVFGEEAFEKFWAPRFRKAWQNDCEAKARVLLAESEVQAEIERFRRLKVREDAEWFAGVGGLP